MGEAQPCDSETLLWWGLVSPKARPWPAPASGMFSQNPTSGQECTCTLLAHREVTAAHVTIKGNIPSQPPRRNRFPRAVQAPSWDGWNSSNCVRRSPMLSCGATGSRAPKCTCGCADKPVHAHRRTRSPDALPIPVRDQTLIHHAFPSSAFSSDLPSTSNA